MIEDIGEIDGPVLLFGGPYSNLEALQALLAQAGAARLICTGDVVAYCGNPRETIALIRDSAAHVIAGNCEIQLGAGAAECGCGFEAGTACDLLSHGWFSFATAHITDADRAWMRGLPRFLCFRHHGRRYAVLHGGVRDVARFLWPVSDADDFTSEWRAVEALMGPVDAIIAGHCGLPFIKSLPQGAWINAGVIGIPPHDGQADTRYARLSEGQVRFHHLRYDAAAAQQKMIAAGLVQGYHDSLLSGYWPSEDVLPLSLRSSACASG